MQKYLACFHAVDFFESDVVCGGEIQTVIFAHVSVYHVRPTPVGLFAIFGQYLTTILSVAGRQYFLSSL